MGYHLLRAVSYGTVNYAVASRNMDYRLRLGGQSLDDISGFHILWHCGGWLSGVSSVPDGHEFRIVLLWYPLLYSSHAVVNSAEAACSSSCMKPVYLLLPVCFSILLNISPQALWPPTSCTGCLAGNQLARLGTDLARSHQYVWCAAHWRIVKPTHCDGRNQKLHRTLHTLVDPRLLSGSVIHRNVRARWVPMCHSMSGQWPLVRTTRPSLLG